MKKLQIAIAALAVLVTCPAFAADFPVKASEPLPPPPAYSWTGFYVGGDAGMKLSSANWTAQCFGSSCAGAPPPGNGQAFTPDGSSPNNFSHSGFTGGVYGGYNWQFLPAWIIGIEADAAWGNDSSSIPGLVGCSLKPQDCVTGHKVTKLGSVADDTSVTAGMDGSVRGRLGFLLSPNVLLYGAGGFAWEDASATENCGSVAFGKGGAWCLAASSQTNNTTLSGWTVGGGIEWNIFGNWMLRAEYRFADYGTWKTSFFPNVNFNSANIHFTANIMDIGLSYKF